MSEDASLSLGSPPLGNRKLAKEKERDTDTDNQAGASAGADTMATLNISATAKAKAKANSSPSSSKEGVDINHISNPPTLENNPPPPLPAAAGPDLFLTPPTRPTANSFLSPSLSPSKESVDLYVDDLNNYPAAGIICSAPKKRKLAEDVDAEAQTSVPKHRATDSDDDSIFETK